MKKKAIKKATVYIFFIIYLLVLLYFLFFSELLGRNNILNTHQFNLIPFNEIKRYWLNKNQIGLVASYLNIFGNILLFIPYGIAIPIMTNGKSGIIKVAFYTLLMSVFVEIVQLVTGVGIFDIDDMILNTAGGVLGYIIFAIFKFFK